MLTYWMDGQPNKVETIDNPGIPLNPEDVFCVQFNWKAYTAGNSPMYLNSKSRSISSQITYRIGW